MGFHLFWALLLVACPFCASLKQETDWLVTPVTTPVTLNTLPNGLLQFTNGLISRVFAVKPDWGTVDYYSHTRNASLLRALSADTIIHLDGVPYAIGGLVVPVPASEEYYPFLNRSSATNFTVNPAAFHYTYHNVTAPTPTYPWTPGTRFAPNVSWPAKGSQLQVHFCAPSSAPAALHFLDVVVHYEMYVGIPLLSKWVSISVLDHMCGGDGAAPPSISVPGSVMTEQAAPSHTTSAAVRLSAVSLELLALNEDYNQVALSPEPVGRLYIEADIPHGASVLWTAVGTQYTIGNTRPAVNCSYASGPGVKFLVNNSSAIHANAGHRQHHTHSPHSHNHNHKHDHDHHHHHHHPASSRFTAPPSTFTSFRVLELVTDTLDYERHSLARRRLTRTLAPATMENPIFFHLTNTTSAGFQAAVDQMAEVGFEMVIFSFGSGFVMETNNTAYLEQIAADIAYAKARGIEVGGYDLICLDRGHGGYGGNVGDQWDAVVDGKLGANACFASGWVDKLSEFIFTFVDKLGLRGVELDGPYGGGSCASTTHAHHVDEEDSVYQQTRIQGQLFHELRQRNVYIHQPDNYFFQGGSKTGMGYSEYQYSLPRWQDLTVSRGSIFDGTYHYLPTQGWMFLPIIDYHSGGAAAAFAPLSEHVKQYEWALAQYLGSGVGACYRGPHLYNDNATKAVVAKWVAFYKKYRSILISDIVHVKRPDLQSIDCILHVNSELAEKGLAMVYNPTLQSRTVMLSLPLYYTGISNTALVYKEGAASPDKLTLQRDYSVEIPLTLGPRSFTWFLIKSGD